jgi:hypothetical protein
MKTIHIILLTHFLIYSCHPEKSKKFTQENNQKKQGFYVTTVEVHASPQSPMLGFSCGDQSWRISQIDEAYQEIQKELFSQFQIPTYAMCAVLISNSKRLLLYVENEKGICNLYYREWQETLTPAHWNKVPLDLLGRWENAAMPEFWIMFDAFHAYNDENESGVPYVLKNDTLFKNGQPAWQIKNLEEDSFFETGIGTKDYRKWVKADF